MPWQAVYCPRRDIFVFQALGKFADGDLISGSEAVARDPHLRPDSRVFLDFGGVEEFVVSDSLLEILNAREAVQNIRGRHAFLIFGPRGAANFQNFLGELCCSRWFRRFISRQEAYEWLNEGLPAEKHISGGPWLDLADFVSGALRAPH